MTEPLDRLKAALADRYAIEREIGRGGMATVYLAEDLKHHRKVAVKVLGADLAAVLGPERFLREIEVAAGLTHPHFLPVHDSGEADGLLYYVMPYVEGESLRDRLNREKQLSVEDALRISREVADALSYAHSQGVIHRDIKPENILLQSGHAVVADFGIARAIDRAGGETLTGTGIPIGTPAYMSPEQAVGSKDLDGRSDLYSLGCVLYEMLAGHPPFVGSSVEGVVYQHISTPPPPITSIRPAVPAQVAATLDRALAKTPADRFRTSGEMTAALAQPVGETKVRKPLSRAKALIYSGTILLGLATVAVIASQRGQAGPEFPEDVVVVLPFSNETGDPANDQVGRMVAHRIVEHLDRSGVARPAPAGAAIFSWGVHLERRAKDPRYDPVAASAAEYGAGTVVQGTIFAQGDQIRFVAELSDRGKARRIRHIDPVLVPPDDHGVSGGMETVAERVAAGVAAQLDPRQGEFLARFVSVPSLAAYRDYTSALEAFFREDFEESRELLERAVQRDPFFFPAVTYLAVVHLNLDSLAVADSILKATEGFLDRMGGFERLQWNWARATLDGNREAAYRAGKDVVALWDRPLWRWIIGFEALKMNYPREALEALSGIDPDTPSMEIVADYWVHLTRALHVLGEHDRELAEARRGRERHPGHPGVLRGELRAHAAVGRLQEVHDLVEEAIVKDAQPSQALQVAARELRAHGHLEASRTMGERALTYLQGRPAETTATRAHRFAVLQALYVLERWEEARPLAEALVQEDPTNPSYLGYLGVLAARGGDGTEAARISRELADLDRPYLRGDNTWWRADIAALLGEREEAVALLRQAHREGRWLDVFPHTDMDLEPLRGFPPFEEFMRPKG